MACDAVGGHMVEIDDGFENTFVTGLMRDKSGVYKARLPHVDQLLNCRLLSP